MSRIVVIDDHESMRTGIALVVERMGHEVLTAASGMEGLEHVTSGPCDLVISDYRMDGMDGLEVLEAVKGERAEADVLIITAHGSIEVAVEAMKRGATDFLQKPFPNDELRLKVERILAHRLDRLERERLDEENQYLREEISGRFGQIIGRSREMAAILATVEKVSATDSSVLIYGESGTGKELVARAIHNQSPRSDGPFVRVNCGALPRELVESELFGHERGSFTGATRQKKGRFELAEGGTIFLDEIGDVPLEVQVKLLRVLQEKEFDRVGAERTLRANVRVVAATNRVLKEMVGEGTFREDLFYRLEVIPLALPPLRERRDDIPLLVEHFLVKKCREINLPPRRLTDEAMEVMCQYPWPGNVRELENIIERTVVLVDGDTVGPNDLPLAAEGMSRGNAEAAADGDAQIALTDQLESLERELILKALEQADGVKTQAATLLGIKTSALYYKLDKYGVH